MTSVEKLNALCENPEVSAKIASFRSQDELKSFLAQNDISFTNDELDTLLELTGKTVGEVLAKDSNQDEISEEQLENVSGGLFKITTAKIVADAWAVTITGTGVAGTALAVGLGVGAVCALGYFGYKWYKSRK